VGVTPLRHNHRRTTRPCRVLRHGALRVLLRRPLAAPPNAFQARVVRHPPRGLKRTDKPRASGKGLERAALVSRRPAHSAVRRPEHRTGGKQFWIWSGWRGDHHPPSRRAVEGFGWPQRRKRV
jgi:hypothetical protein